MIDTNVSIGHWPFHKLPGSQPTSVTASLERNGIHQAWVNNLEGLFDRDITSVNQRLVEFCGQAPSGLLVPFGTINPTLPAWEEDLQRCVVAHKFRGIRLHPGAHGYDLNHPALAPLLALAAERNLIVQLVVMMEDERTQHPVFRIPAVDLAPLPQLVKTIPSLRLVVLNAFRKLTLDDAATLAASGRVWFDIAMLEGVDRVSALVEKVGAERILFGSHFPLFYIESAVLKLRETMLPGTIVEMIKVKNAQKLFSQE